MPPDVADYFLSELAKVYIEEDNLSKLSAFFCFRPDNFTFRRLFAHKTQNFQTIFGYSIVKYRKNEKERQL